MEIEFNASQLPPIQRGGPTARASASAPSGDANSSQTVEALKARLRDLPMVRADKVAEAQALVSGSKYPPDDILDRIAILLAIRFQK
jgi:hypothetical protein